jgi:hypothetical protein
MTVVLRGWSQFRWLFAIAVSDPPDFASPSTAASQWYFIGSWHSQTSIVSRITTTVPNTPLT